MQLSAQWRNCNLVLSIISSSPIVSHGLNFRNLASIYDVVEIGVACPYCSASQDTALPYSMRLLKVPHGPRLAHVDSGFQFLKYRFILSTSHHLFLHSSIIS